MSLKATSGIMLTLMLTSMLTLIFGIQLVKATSLPVHNIDTNEDYSTIQEAINANDTLDGHTILVDAGVYYESVVINKSIILIGESKEITIIDGLKTGTVVSVTAQNIVITGFTIQRSAWNFPHSGIHLGRNATITNNNIYDNWNGIRAESYYGDNIISNNNITNNWSGICLLNSNGNTIFNNTIISNEALGIACLSRSGYNIIRNNTIDSHEASGIALHESDGNIIINNLVTRNGQAPNVTPSNGINLEDSHSNVVGNNTIIENVDSGVNLYGSNDNDVSGNFMINNTKHGIHLEYSDGNTLANNTITNNKGSGIRLSISRNNSVSSNNVNDNDEFGIRLDASGANTLNFNVMINNWYNFRVSGSQLSEFVNNVDSSNTLDGKPIFYYVNQRDLVIDSQTLQNIGYLGLVNSTNITVRNLNLTSKWQGMLLAFVSNSTLENIYASKNEYGIYLILSTTIQILGSTIIDNRYGIYLWSDGARNNVIYNNTISNNNIAGVYLSGFVDSNMISHNTISDNADGIHLEHGGSNNTITNNTILRNNNGIYARYSDGTVIYHNNFVDNDVQAYNYGSANIWHDRYPSGGNYWSDYIGEDDLSGILQNESGSDGIIDTPYIIDPDNQDRYPLISPLGAIIRVFNTYMDTKAYRVKTFSNSSISMFNFNQSLMQISFNVTGLSGTIGFCNVTIPNTLLWGEITVLVDGQPPLETRKHTDRENTFIYFTYLYSVHEVVIQSFPPPDITAPTISILSPQEYNTYAVNDVPLTFTVSESTSWIFYSLDEQANITIAGNTTLTGLSDGMHNLVVYASDIAGNIGSSSMVYFTIQTIPIDTTPPAISIVSPENKTYDTTDVPLTFTVDESVSWMAYSLDNKVNVTVTGNTTLSGLSEGSYSLIVYAKDTSGNIGASEMVYFSTVTQQPEPQPAVPWQLWIIVAIVIIAVVGTGLLVYFTKVKKTTEKVK